MSGIFHHSLGPAISQFRANTDKTSAMAGVTIGSFLCRACGQPKLINGRKSIGHKAGFRCAECHEKFMAKFAANTADKTMAPSQGGNPREPSKTRGQL